MNVWKCRMPDQCEGKSAVGAVAVVAESIGEAREIAEASAIEGRCSWAVDHSNPAEPRLVIEERCALDCATCLEMVQARIAPLAVPA